jgi:hypothetical protein
MFHTDTIRDVPILLITTDSRIESHVDNVTRDPGSKSHNNIPATTLCPGGILFTSKSFYPINKNYLNTQNPTSVVA